MRMYADRPSDEPDAAGPDTGRFGAHHAGGRVARLGPQDRRFPDPSYPDARYGTPRRTRHHPPVTPGGRTKGPNWPSCGPVRRGASSGDAAIRRRGTLLTLRDCDAPYYAADSILPRYYSEGERKRAEWQQEHLNKIQKRREKLRADRRAPAHAFTLAAGYLSGCNHLDALGVPWQGNTHRGWSLEAAYTYTHITRVSFGLRYLYSYDRHSQLSDVYDYDYLPQFQKCCSPQAAEAAATTSRPK